MRRRRGSLAGFTLVELLITIVILAIILTLAAPSFVDVQDRRRIVDAVETMVKQVHQARAVAIETSREILMVFREAEVDEDWGWCFGLTDTLDGCDCSPDALPDDLCEIPLSFVFADAAAEERVVVRASSDQFGNRVALAAPPTEDLLFEPLRGLRVDTGRTVEWIEFQSARGREARVVVNLLGRASTCSPDGSVETMRVCP